MYPGLQEQASCPLTSLQMELGPHGSGTHGMCGAGVYCGVVTLNYVMASSRMPF